MIWKFWLLMAYDIRSLIKKTEQKVKPKQRNNSYLYFIVTTNKKAIQSTGLTKP